MMTPKEIDETLKHISKLKYYVQQLQSNPHPNMCGLCLQEFKPSDGRSMYMKDDIPFQTSHHMDCGDLLHAREQHLAIMHLVRKAPWRARKFLEEEEMKALEWLKSARQKVLDRLARERK